MDAEQSRETAPYLRRRLVVHRQNEEATVRRMHTAGQIIANMIQGMTRMGAAAEAAQLGLSQVMDAAGWEWGPDAFHSGPEDEGNDQHE